MRPVLFALLLPIACSAPAEPGAADGAAATAAPAPQPKPPAAARTVTEEETELYSFEFAYPEAAGRIPSLRARLERERDEARRDLIATAAADRKELVAGGLEYRAHSHHQAWQVVADLPGWLSLSAVISTYGGGAHPNHGFDALLWDKARGSAREPIDLFAPQAFRSAVAKRFCAELDRQRARKRRGEPVGGADDPFNACIDPLEDATVILGSSNRRTFDRVGFLIAPYSAGPYAEGDYEITLPVDGALLAAVRPEFRKAFAPRR